MKRKKMFGVRIVANEDVAINSRQKFTERFDNVFH